MNRVPRSAKLEVLGGIRVYSLWCCCLSRSWNWAMLNPRFALQLYFFYSSSLLERHAARRLNICVTGINVPLAAMKNPTVIDSPPSPSLRP